MFQVTIMNQPENTVKLQGIPGYQPAKPVRELTPGNIICWNFGYTSEVLKVQPSKTGKTYTVTTRSADTGNVYERKMGANRLVVVVGEQ